MARRPWYEDDKRRTHVATYTGDRQMADDIERATAAGWTIQHTSVKGSILRRLPWLFRPVWAKDIYIVTFMRQNPG